MLLLGCVNSGCQTSTYIYFSPGRKIANPTIKKALKVEKSAMPSLISGQVSPVHPSRLKFVTLIIPGTSRIWGFNAGIISRILVISATSQTNYTSLDVSNTHKKTN